MTEVCLLWLFFKPYLSQISQGTVPPPKISHAWKWGAPPRFWQVVTSWDMVEKQCETNIPWEWKAMSKYANKQARKTGTNMRPSSLVCAPTVRDCCWSCGVEFVIFFNAWVLWGLESVAFVQTAPWKSPFGPTGTSEFDFLEVLNRRKWLVPPRQNSPVVGKCSLQQQPQNAEAGEIYVCVRGSRKIDINKSVETTIR